MGKQTPRPIFLLRKVYSYKDDSLLSSVKCFLLKIVALPFWIRKMCLFGHRAFLVSLEAQPNALVYCFCRIFYPKTASHFKEKCSRNNLEMALFITSLTDVPTKAGQDQNHDRQVQIGACYLCNTTEG